MKRSTGQDRVVFGQPAAHVYGRPVDEYRWSLDVPFKYSELVLKNWIINPRAGRGASHFIEFLEDQCLDWCQAWTTSS